MRILLLILLSSNLLLLFCVPDDRFYQNSKVYKLNENEFDDDTKLGKNHQPWFIMFHHPEHEASMDLLPNWIKFAPRAPSRVKVGIVNCQEEPGLADRFGTWKYPTLIYMSAGRYYLYPESGDFEDLEEFVTKGYASQHPDEVPLASKFLRILLKVLSFIGIGTVVLIFALMFFICICEYFGPDDDEQATEKEEKEGDEPLIEVKKSKKKDKKPKVEDDKTKDK